MLDLSSLNAPQRTAVTHRDGPLLVLAGAGSGKTRVITFRIAWLIEQGVRPENILAVSFTNKAAGEMRERVAGLLGHGVAHQVHLSTFHALGATILREDIEALGYRTPFLILDESDRFRIIRDGLKELNLSGTSSNERHLLQIISRAKAAMTTPAQLPEARYNPEMPRAQRIFGLYERQLRNLNAVDFDDLLLLPTKLLAERGDLRVKYRQRFRYIMVDEYQDTNPIQLRMLQELVATPQRNLVVVGDDDQSIYGFRGAVADNILDFEHRFPGTRVVTLDQNYRSVGSILQAANAVIAHNDKRRSKNLWSNLGSGEPIESTALPSDTAEAEYMARRIRGMRERSGRPWRDFAVLYRTNTQTRVIEEVFRQEQIPYRVVGGQSLFDRKEVKDVLAYLRLLLFPDDELSLRRVINYPQRGIGSVSVAAIDERSRDRGISLMAALRAALDEGALPERARGGASRFLRILDGTREALRGKAADTLPEVLASLIADIGLEQAVLASEKNAKIARVRWNIVEDLLASVERSEGANAWARLDRFVQSVSLDPPRSGEEEEETNRVTLLTLHSSKGLEFPIVFMCGMNEGLLPHRRALEAGEGVNEERRLCYVGMTRARERLILTRARTTLKRNERMALRPSRFLDEIPASLIIERGAEAEQEMREAQLQRNQEHFARLRAKLLGST